MAGLDFTTKKRNLFIVLSGIFLTNAILAEIIGVKIFSAEGTFGMAPAQIKLLDGFVLDFNLTVSIETMEKSYETLNKLSPHEKDPFHAPFTRATYKCRFREIQNFIPPYSVPYLL